MQFAFLVVGVLFFCSNNVFAQTADPANFYHHFKTSNEAEEAVEKYAAKLDSYQILDKVASQTSATKQDMIVFSNYYVDTIYNDRANYVGLLLSTINTDDDIKAYANGLIAKYVSYYQKLKQIEKDFPSTATEYSTAQSHKSTATCNPTCSDIGFESGNLSGWNAYYAGNNSSPTKMTYTAVVGGVAGAVTKAAYDIVNPGNYHPKPTYQVAIMSGTGNDPIAGSIIPIVAPGGGSYSCRLGDTSVGGSRVGIIDQQFTVTAGNTALNYMYAPVIDMPAYNKPHTFGQQPHFIITITDVATGDTLQCGQYLVASSTTNSNYTPIYYKVPAYGWLDTVFVAPWKSVYVSLQNYVGHCIDIQAIVSDCYPTAVGPHFCYCYFDATCGPHSIVASTPSICGGNVTLTAPGGGTYSWAGPGVVGSNTSQTITANATGTYTVTITSPDGCSDTVQKPITITPTMSVTATSTNGTCSGAGGTGTATPTGGTPPYTYAWSNGNTNAKDTGLAAGSYTCTVTAAGCVQTVTVTVTKPTPMTTSTASTSTPCGVSSGTASVTVGGGSPTYTYLWSNSQTTSSMSGLAAASYSVTITDANGCTTTANVTVPSANGPRDSIVSSKNVTCFGGNNGNAVVGVANGASPYTYAWSTTPVQTSDTASNLTAGNYTVTITDNTGCTASTNVVITQPPALRDSITNAVEVLCFGGNNGSASVGVKGGTPVYTYSWNSTPAQTTITASNLIAGTYTVDVTDANGCKDSTKVTITQPAPITLQTTVFPATCSYLCNGQAIVVPSGGSAPYTYTWSNGGSGANINNLCVSTSYTVTVTDGHGCKADTNVVVGNPPPIVLTASTTPSLCNKADGGATVNATGGTPGYTYSWLPSGGNAASAANLTAGTYTVYVTDANKCKDTTKAIVMNQGGDSVKIISVTNVPCYNGNEGTATANAMGGAAPYTYSWSPIGGNTTVAANLIAGVYTVTITDANGCSANTIATITQPTPVTLTVPGQTICIGQTATLSAAASGGTPTYTYSWTGGTTPTTGATVTATPTTTTTYTVQATDANGCMSPQVTVTVTVRPPLAVVAGPPKSICPGSSATIGAVASGGDGTYFYSWTPNGETTTSITVTPNITTTYTVIASDNCGTPVVTDSVTITVLPVPVVNFVADTLQGCYPLCVNFTNQATVTGGTITSSDWVFGDGDTSSASNPKHCYTKPGVFTVSLTVTSSNGCSASKTINNYITVYGHPDANFSLSPQPTDINSPTIYFKDLSTDAYGIANWFWQFGDETDTSGIIRNPQHTYKDTGWYCVNLAVTNIHGCVDDTTQCLYISPFFVIYVPNAFTPNSDGKNDLFTAKGVGILEYDMWIFDRWGQQLYHTNDIYGGWDGVVQHGTTGQESQEDTYVWLIEVTDVFHKNHRYVGRVSLIK